MSTPDLIAKAIAAMVAINAAIRNIRLYPAGSAMVKTSVERVLPPLGQVLDAHGSLTFAESEKVLLVFNDPLSESELKKPQAAAFLEILLDFGIRDLTFQQGVSGEELEALFALLSQKPEDVHARGGLQRLLQEAELPHILVDHKVYVAVGKDQVVTSAESAERKAPVSTPGDRGTGLGAGIDIPVQQEGRGHEDLAAAVHGGISRLTRPDTLGKSASQALLRMIDLLDDEDHTEQQPGLKSDLAKALAGMAPDALARVLVDTPPGVHESGVLTEMADLLDDDAFSALAARLQAAGTQDSGTGGPAVFETLKRSEKGQRLSGRIEDMAETQKQSRLTHLKAGTQAIMGGDITGLNDAEVARSIPRSIGQLMAKGKQQAAATLIKRMHQGLRSDDAATRAAAAAVIAETSAVLLSQGHQKAAHEMTVDLVGWIHSESIVVPATEDVYAALQQQTQALLRQGDYRQANRLLKPLDSIIRGDIPKEQGILAICENTVMAIADREALDLVMKGCCDAEGTCVPEGITSLSLLCPQAAIHLLDALEDTTDRSRRIRARHIYPELGDAGLPELLERLDQDAPWTTLRDLVWLVGKMGDSAHLDHLEPLLHHDEPRVQREVLDAIYAIGGDRRGKLLTRYLPAAGDQMKIAVVALLGALAHAPAVPALISLLENKNAVSTKHRDALQIKICQALEAIGSAEAVPALTQVAKQKGGLLKAHAADVQEAARKALAALQNKSGEPETTPTPESHPPAPSAPKVSAEDAAKEQEVDALVAAGNTDAAVKLLFELIVSQARSKNFTRAEALRDKLMAVDEMALMEIVNAAEIIESEKSAALEGGVMERWQGICRKLSPEEINALFYGMDTVEYPADTVILKQDQINDRLFFINQGKAKAVYEDGKTETLLRAYEPGEVAGADSFFNIKVCTTSLVAMTPVVAMTLPRSTLAQWKDSQPALEPKLFDHFLKEESEQNLLKKAGLNPRRATRIKVRGKLRIQVVDTNNAPLGKPFRGELADISAGGMCFLIKTPTADTARKLLGRRLQLTFGIPGKDGAPRKTTRIGKVLSVNYMMQSDYTVHIRFAERLADADTAALEALTSGGSKPHAPAPPPKDI